VGIAGGSAVLGQKVLEAVFGDAAVRRLAENARKDLRRRVAALLRDEEQRFLALLDEQGMAPGAADRVRDAARAVDDLRFSTKVV
jgi:acyl-CoA reductase-like NAD-dependent aldehyde dehydrogenase